ncbi:PadR family transcriptional regulator [Nonomuraea diastatica]|uniref:PadR family transcriptional regulator n=1 Tax=Nonomuraea diastatica TaxID=1848329 RepID=A0A4R4WDK2_9ACTN|nr:PadR family transcriptional regulator [Nonomuraea diastatica]TDD15307.1 PadR family transcriptional regulator [Nonomuraea diastatica]
MSAIRLLILGAVRLHGRAHGYQVRNDLAFWGADSWSTTKPGSIYHALKSMAKQGLLHAYDTAPSTAGGPPRTEYEVTEKGAAEFFSLLRQALTTHDRMDLLSAGIGFMVELPREEVIALLQERLANLEGWREAVTSSYTAEDDLGHIGEIMSLWAHSAEGGLEWTRGLIERIQGGAHDFAGEGGDPFAGVLAEDQPSSG